MANASNGRQWTHKVVKRSRGMNGKMFDFRTAATFSSETEAREYAQRFAVEQSGVAGTEITVRTRAGSCLTGKGALVAVYLPGGSERGVAS